MVKVVIPYFKYELTDLETISLSTIRRYVDSSLIVFIVPNSFNQSGLSLSRESVERFEDNYFESTDGYNSLMTSSNFYERFSDLSHILVCQLDCLIFRNELDYWISKNYDYIAAPWFERFEENPSNGLWRVGNGGFSLRKVDSHLRVLKQQVIKGSIYPKNGSKPWEPTSPNDEVGMYRKINPWYQMINPFVEKTSLELELLKYPFNEDLFWSLEAPKCDPTFRVSTAEEALPFAFEMAPRWCFEKNQRRLPFGCHAWARYDRNFWEEMMTKFK